MELSRVLWLEHDPGLAIAGAAEALLHGRAVLFPTDTVYGLLALATSRDGYAELYRIKAREPAKPLQLLCPPGAALALHALALLAEHAQAQAQFAAGRLTLVFDPAGSPGLAPVLQELQPGPVGLRITHYQPLLQLLGLAGPPQLLWASSANKSGAAPCCAAPEAQAWLEAATPPPVLAVLSSVPGTGQPSAVLRLEGATLHKIR
jgi:tRNA A37 threonylcarbamoyladenosine synthetase subunit TsaC/SUA5/YrdC